VSFHPSRAARKTVLVCLALVLSLVAVVGVAFTARASGSPNARIHSVASAERTTLDGAVRGKYSAVPTTIEADGASMIAFPPRSKDAKAITVVYLHGIHGLPQNGCPWLREGASELGWLVCPAANSPLPNGTFSWGGPLADQHAVVARAERAAQSAGADSNSANVLVGFSQGSYLAVDLVNHRLGNYRGLVLVAAEVEPSADVLRDAGVKRVALAAGQLDGSYAPLRRTAERLRRQGVDVRFVDLGKIGHTYQTTETAALASAIAWAGGKDA
jgi:pimeloyl-ACP methyl ester carboxylesterase